MGVRPAASLVTSNGWALTSGALRGGTVSTPMIATGQGDWKTRLPLQPGRYRYRFVVDGAWVTDPNNKYVETNQFGELNNVVEVD